MPDHIYCSEQNAHEPLIGTADQVDVWILLEYRGAWGARAVEQSDLGGARRWLDDNLAALAAAGLRARPQLVRQPDDDPDRVRLFVGVPDALLCFGGADHGFLDGLSLVEVVAHPEAHTRAIEPHYFVCTNGRRDVCCARFGLPIYARLRERLGDRAWQTTHLGGHRFAPNVLVLPQGGLYGRVGEDRLDAFVARIEAGELAFGELRGRSWYPPAAQAAEALSGRSDLSLAGIDGDDGRATVRFEAPSGSFSITVRRADEPLSVRKSCGDEAAAAVTPFLAALAD